MAYRRTDQMADRLAGKRARILAAAQAIVAEEGWPTATIANVALRADVAAGTIYRYWPAKADLCAEIVATVSAREIGVVRAIAESDAPSATKLAAAIRTFATRALRGRRLAYALIAEPLDPEVEQVRLDYRARLAGCFEQILREGRAEGRFAELEPAVAAACVVGAVMEALIGPLAPAADMGRAAERRLVEAITRFCLAASLGAVAATA
jgi:AcrR family transcriptional regulator